MSQTLPFNNSTRLCVNYNQYTLPWQKTCYPWWRTAGEKYVTECLRMVSRNRIVSVMVWVVIGYHGIGNPVILNENVNADNYVRRLSENLTNDNAPVHTVRRTVAWLEQQNISTIQWPSQSTDLNIIEQVWDFMGREIIRVMPVTRNNLIRALHNSYKISVSGL